MSLAGKLGNADLESICLADSESDSAYIGVEQNPISIQEFNLSKGQVTREFDLELWLSGYGNEGLAGLTFIPNNQHAEDDRFYVGIQVVRKRSSDWNRHQSHCGFNRGDTRDFPVRDEYGYGNR